MRDAKTVFRVIKEILIKLNSISKVYFPMCLLNAFINSVLPIILVIIPSVIIDAIVIHKDNSKAVYYAVIYIISSALLKIVMAIMKQKLNQLSIHIENELQLTTNMAMVKGPYEKLEERKVHLLIQKLHEGQNAVGKITSVINNILGGMIQAVFGIILYLPILSRLVKTHQYMGYNSTVFFLLILIIVCIVNSRITIHCNEKKYNIVNSFLNVEKEYGYYVSLRADYEYGADIRLNKLSEMLRTGMKKYNSLEKNMHFTINKFGAKTESLIATISNGQLILIYAFVTSKIISETITIGEFYLYTNAICQMIEGIRKILNFYSEIKLSTKYYDAYLDLWELSKQDSETQEDVTQNNVSEHIVYQGVSFQYPGCKNWIIRDLNLTIHEGEHIAIVGRNGSGKSTLIKLLIGLYPYKKGHIYIQGTDIQSVKREKVYEHFGIVFQDYRLFAATVAENIAATNMNIDDRRIQRVLSQIGLNQRLAESDMNKMVTRHLDEDGIIFSGGEEQKLALGRALYKNASIVVMDEPLASLDPIAERDINKMTNELLKGITTIIVSHRLSTCVMCDRILVLEEGRIVEEGNHKDLLKHDGVYAKMWKMQAQYYSSSPYCESK